MCCAAVILGIAVSNVTNVCVIVQKTSKAKYESKFAAAKKVLKKQLKVNTKVVFDDDGLVSFIYGYLLIYNLYLIEVFYLKFVLSEHSL